MEKTLLLEQAFQVLQKEESMIISKTPFRISLVGGGTDFEDYYKINGGSVVSFTIDKSMFVTVNKKFDGKLHLRYSKTEVGNVVDDLRHDIVKECLKFVDINGGIEIVIISDIPSVGTGLGSSSALTVGLLKSLFAYVGKEVYGNQLAEMACDIEINRLKAPIGKQDQYACALGGLQQYIFNKDGSVENRDLYIGNWTRIFDELLDSLLVFYIPNGRKSSKILKVYKRNIKSNMAMLKLNADFVDKFLLGFKSGTITPKEVGDILNDSWKIKSASSPATNELVDTAIKVALESGSFGAKVAGAGGGGFLLSAVRDKIELINKMESSGFKLLDFSFCKEGSQIVYRNHNDKLYI